MASKGTQNISFFSTTHGFNICHCKKFGAHVDICNKYFMHSIILLIQTIRQFDFFRSNAAGCFSNSVLSGVEKIKGNMHQYIIIFM